MPSARTVTRTLDWWLLTFILWGAVYPPPAAVVRIASGVPLPGWP